MHLTEINFGLQTSQKCIRQFFLFFPPFLHVKGLGMIFVLAVQALHCGDSRVVKANLLCQLLPSYESQ